MGIKEEAIKDNMEFTSNEDEFAEPVTLTSPDGSKTATLSGIRNKHHLKLKAMGDSDQVVNSLVACVTVNEKNILVANPDYPTRDSGGIVAMKDHKVTVTELVSGKEVTYIVIEQFADETLGMIVLSLGEYED